MDRKQIGKQIEEIRKKKGLSQAALADLLNIQQSTISKIESGAFSCTIDYLSKIGKILGFTIELIEDDIQQLKGTHAANGR